MPNVFFVRGWYIVDRTKFSKTEGRFFVVRSVLEFSVARNGSVSYAKLQFWQEEILERAVAPVQTEIVLG